MKVPRTHRLTKLEERLLQALQKNLMDQSKLIESLIERGVIKGKKLSRLTEARRKGKICF